MNKTNNLRAYLRDLYEGIVSKKPDASRNPQNFRSEIEAIRTGGEFYEVMDASELPLDAPDGSLALVEGEPIPQSYTVQSVDELPSDAVDGSLAIVAETVGDTGTWLLNNEIEQGALTLGSVEFLQFICNGVNYGSVVWNNYGPGGGITALTANVADGEGNVFYINNPSGSYGIAHGWTDEQYRTIDVSYALEKTLSWLAQNGRKISESNTPPHTVITTSSLYTHENGEWVYKGEVA